MKSIDLQALEAALTLDAPAAQRTALGLLGRLQDFFQAHPTVDAIAFEEQVLLSQPELVGLVLVGHVWDDQLSSDGGLNDPFADLQVDLNTDLGNLAPTDRRWCLERMFYPDPAGEHTFLVAATTLETCFRQVLGEDAWGRFSATQNQEHLDEVLPGAATVSRPRM